jgi:hypothetical protein
LKPAHYFLSTVIAGLVPAIHGNCSEGFEGLRSAQALHATLVEQWITATSAVMTIRSLLF